VAPVDPRSIERGDASPVATNGAADLSSDELERYDRQLILPEMGIEGQRRLKSGRVLLVGAGGLGSPAALYLAAAGVGTLGIVDYDVVDPSNLHRQILHGTSSVESPKVDSAVERIRDLNPYVAVEPFQTRLTSANALEVLDGFDIVVDGTDNFATRYLVNDACVMLGIPNVYGSVSRFEGQASVLCAPDGPCYRCLFPTPPPPGLVPSCAEGGVLGVLPGLVGMIQTTEALKLLLGVGETLVGRLLLVDALGMRFRTVRVQRDATCPACGTREIDRLIDYDQFCGSGAEPHAAGGGVIDITPHDLAARIASSPTELDLVDVREPHEWQRARIPGARLMPLSAFAASAPTLDRSRDIVLYCHHGMRSQMAADHLLSLGFTRVWNLVGGIDRWSLDVDPTVPRY
jgi:sulfur-carrier protein adenylyltransferase/sulfurtransferase